MELGLGFVRNKTLISILKASIQVTSRIIHQTCNLSNWTLPTGYDTGISVYNSVTKSKVPFILRNPSYAGWYMCGPTVYDSAHIGHACSFVKFDIIRRILINHFNINVVLVMGITNVDDKIITRATERKEDIKTLTKHYENEFITDMTNLNILAPTYTTRVTDFIPQIITFVQEILIKKQGYVTEDGSVYFDTPKFTSYGKLFPASEETDAKSSPGKRSALDFALWKGAKPGEPWWPSPWGTGKGRPGWHIECSAMASAVLGHSLDLHSGGVDLLFPHHENEEAQSCVAHGITQWVNYWLHAGHLHLKGDLKMSKSLNNTISIQELLQKHSANEFRIFCLLSRYRNGVEFSDLTMNNAVSICKKIELFLNNADSYIRGQVQGNIDEPKLVEMLAHTQSRVQSSLRDDFDTSKSITSLLELVSVTNKMLHNRENNYVSYSASMGAVANFVRHTMTTFGVDFTQKESTSSASFQLESVLDRVVEFRDQVRLTALDSSSKKKVLLQSCDQLRDQLATVGVVIKDHGKTSSWNFASNTKLSS